MTLGHGPKFITNGLIFAYDMPQSPGVYSKSWRGRPTTNYIWHANPRIDSSYSSYVNTTSGTWPQNHNDAITVYSKGGSNISAYVNTGVTDWTNTFHAHWVFDPELGRPVVIMRNYDGGQWKAKYIGVGKTKADMGLAVGDTYTISWLQWTDNISRSAYVGLYSNNGTSNNFWDGLQYAYNTKVATWQRVYATYTVSNNGTTYSTNVYMYGHNGGAGVLKIADVQLEKGGPSTFISGDSEANSTRSTTSAILDWTGNHTITANSLTYESNGTFSFNGSTNYMTVSGSSDWAFGGNGGIEQWVYPTNSTGNDRLWCVNNNSTSIDAYLNGSTYNLYYHGGVVNGGTLTPNAWNNVFVTYTGGVIQTYINGIPATMGGTTSGYNITNSATLYIGRYVSTGYELYGKIGNMKIYNRALTAEEVYRNFQALRGRYGI